MRSALYYIDFLIKNCYNLNGGESIMQRIILDKDVPEGYVPVFDYLRSNGISDSSIGVYISKKCFNTLIKIKGVYYGDKKDIDKFLLFKRDYLSFEKFTVTYGLGKSFVKNLISEGLIEDYYCKNGKIFINKNANPIPNGYILLSKYVKLNNIQSYARMNSMINAGLYNVLSICGTRFIKADAVYHDYIRASDYAVLNGVPYKTVLKDCKAGKYDTAIQSHGKEKRQWFIDSAEPLKSRNEEYVVLKLK